MGRRIRCEASQHSTFSFSRVHCFDSFQTQSHFPASSRLQILDSFLPRQFVWMTTVWRHWSLTHHHYHCLQGNSGFLINPRVESDWVDTSTLRFPLGTPELKKRTQHKAKIKKLPSRYMQTLFQQKILKARMCSHPLAASLHSIVPAQAADSKAAH